MLLVLAALLVAGGAWGLSTLLGSGQSAAGPAIGSSPATTVESSPGTIESASAPWLGAQLESLPGGGVVIATVAPGGPADQAGLDPGDVISQIDNRPIGGLSDVTAAIGSNRAGDSVEVQVSRGSTILTTSVVLASGPMQHP